MRKNDKGFTLIELLVTIGIISVLLAAAVVVIRPLDYIKRSRDARRMSDVKVIQTALEQYYGTDNGYPSSIPASGGALTDGTITFLNTTPMDPSGGGYAYAQAGCDGVANTGKYTLCASLEMSSGTSCTGITGNYCVTNPF